MAKRDYGLLDAAGISIADAAKLFNRSRQAIYTGIAHDRPYFSAENARTALEYTLAMGRDPARIDGLVNFIDENYPQSENKLTESELMPERVGFERLSRFVGDADEILVLFNGTLELLTPTATFARVLKELLPDRDAVRFIVQGNWVVSYIEEKLKVHIPAYEVRSDFAHYPSFVLTRKQSTYAAFLFMRFSIAEMRSNEAAELWTHAAATFGESGEHISREAG